MALTAREDENNIGECLYYRAQPCIHILFWIFKNLLKLIN